MSVSGIGSGGGFDLSKMALSMATKIVKELDTDQSGSVNKSEFVTGMTAKGVSATDASAKFDSINTEKTGSISQSDIETNIKSSAPKDGAPPGGGAKPPSGAKGAPLPEAEDKPMVPHLHPHPAVRNPTKRRTPTRMERSAKSNNCCIP